MWSGASAEAREAIRGNRKRINTKGPFSDEKRSVGIPNSLDCFKEFCLPRGKSNSKRTVACKVGEVSQDTLYRIAFDIQKSRHTVCLRRSANSKHWVLAQDSKSIQSTDEAT